MSDVCTCQLPAPPDVYELGCGDQFAVCCECNTQVEPGPCKLCKLPGLHWTFCCRCLMAIAGKWGDA